MSTDMLAVRTETGLPPHLAHPDNPAPPADVPPAPAPRTLLEQRLHDIEQQLRSVVSAVASARQGARDSLAELQQRCSSLTTEILRMGARQAQSAREQEVTTHRLDMLEPRLQRQGQQIDVLAEDLQQRTGHLHITLGTLQTKVRDEQAARIGLSVTQDKLELDLQRLQDDQTEHERALDLRLQEGHRRQRRFAALFSSFALGIGGILAWQQFDLAAAPAPVREELMVLQADIDRHDALAEEDARHLSAQEEKVALLAQALEKAQAELRQLRRELRTGRDQVAALRLQVDTLKHAQAAPGLLSAEAPEAASGTASMVAPDVATEAAPTATPTALATP